MCGCFHTSIVDVETHRPASGANLLLVQPCELLPRSCTCSCVAAVFVFFFVCSTLVIPTSVIYSGFFQGDPCSQGFILFSPPVISCFRFLLCDWVQHASEFRRIVHIQALALAQKKYRSVFCPDMNPNFRKLELWRHQL